MPRKPRRKLGDISSKLTSTATAKDLIRAIANRNTITFWYSGPKNPNNFVSGQRKPVKPGRRIHGEPVALGISPRNRLLIRVHVQPPSVSLRGFDEHGWRTFMVSRMSKITIHNRTNFTLTRPKYNGGGNDGSFIKTLYSIDPAEVTKTAASDAKKQREKEKEERDKKEFEKKAIEKAKAAKKALPKDMKRFMKSQEDRLKRRKKK